ncbi:MAG: hypothetical protein R3B06_30245 [Kofleriaceae bacterium]
MRGRRAIAAASVALALLAGCRVPAPPRAAVGAGRAVTLYATTGEDPAGVALVDDRRWLDVPADGWLWLTDVAATLDLATVTLASVAAPGSLTVAACRRGGAEVGLTSALVGRQVEATLTGGSVVTGEVTAVGVPVAVRRGGDPDVPDAVAPQLTVTTAAGLQIALPAAQVTAVRVTDDGATGLGCRVRSRRPGRQLVRVSYAVDGARWDAAYRLGVPDGAGDGAVAVALAPRFTVVAPQLRWTEPVELRLAAGVPGRGQPPAVVWQGPVHLDGATVVVPGLARPRAGATRWVYRGMVDAGGRVTDDDWGTASTGAVVRELAVPIVAGDVAGRVVRDGATGGGAIVVPAPGPGTTVRVTGAASHALVGYRRKRLLVRDGTYVADEVVYSVANRGDVAATVVIDEPLRARAVAIRFELPAKAGVVVDDHWQRVVDVPAGGMVRGAVVFEYRRLE